MFFQREASVKLKDEIILRWKISLNERVLVLHHAEKMNLLLFDNFSSCAKIGCLECTPQHIANSNLLAFQGILPLDTQISVLFERLLREKIVQFG